MSNLTEIKVPEIGDFTGVEIIEILVAPGDEIQPEQSLITLESDKAAMEVPAPIAGTVREIKLKVGDKVSAGDVIALVEEAEAKAEPVNQSEHEGVSRSESVRSDTPLNPSTTPVTEEETVVQRNDQVMREPRRSVFRGPPVPLSAEDAPTSRGKPHASPAIRRFARELGVDLHLVTGSGRKGRILKEDVQVYVKQRLTGGMGAATGVAGGSPGRFTLPAPPAIDFSQFGRTETVALNKIRRLAAENLQRSWISAPHVTQFDEADITELESFRQANSDAAKASGGKLSLLPFLLKASVAALRAYPEINASLHPDSQQLILKRYFHIGVAVDTPQGLVVPVIRDVDKKGLMQLAQELVTVSENARARKLAPTDLQGGCFTISSLGGIGGTQFTPIVNAPEVAILGVARAQTKPTWDGQAFQPRLMLPLALSYDHRVVDGALGARFVTYLRQLLGDIRRLLL